MRSVWMGPGDCPNCGAPACEAHDVPCVPERMRRRVAMVIFEPFETTPTSRYAYFIPEYAQPLAVGDLAIVENVRQAGLAILVKVVEIDPPKNMRDKATKWLVGKIDWDPYRALRDLAPHIEGEN